MRELPLTYGSDWTSKLIVVNSRLNMPHDDDKVKCADFKKTSSHSNIMSRVLDNNTFPWEWSECSKHFVTEFLEWVTLPWRTNKRSRSGKVLRWRINPAPCWRRLSPICLVRIYFFFIAVAVHVPPSEPSNRIKTADPLLVRAEFVQIN